MLRKSRTYPNAPIAVFDSGLGGLTVVRALRNLLPHEEIIYFGDTARVPYGNKSSQAVIRFTTEICQFLLRFEPKCIIAACNTASALAVPTIRSSMPIPVVGVVQPTAAMALQRSAGELAAVLGTEATIASGAYEQAIHELNPRLRVIQQSCPLLVPIIEEGRSTDDPLTRLAIHDYLAPIQRLQPDVVLLGCTHYPILRSALQEYFGHHVELIDPGVAVAEAVRVLLQAADMLSPATERGRVQCYVSDFPQRFSAIGTRFLGEPLVHVIRACPDTWGSPGAPDDVACSA